MATEEFLNKCEKIVRDYTNESLTYSPYTMPFEVYIVWYCKTLQNHKAIMTTSYINGIIFELTYNGDKNQLYVDIYNKSENKCIDCE